MHHHHRAAVVTITLASAGDIALGTAFGVADRIGVADGLYFAVTTSTTKLTVLKCGIIFA